MTIQETLAEGTRRLKMPSPSSFIDTPGLDAALLLAEILRVSREELIAHGNDPVSEKDREDFSHLVKRRRNGECIAYILGRREFRGLEFTVSPDVLVPRPETETLVEAALCCVDWLTKQQTESLSLLDLCTGSGAIAVSLKKERALLNVTASDISSKALEIAGRNAARLLDAGPANSANSVRLIQSGLFENIPDRFDIIVSNPPYVPSGSLATLSPEVRLEPCLALDGGKDGLDLIRRIISLSPDHLLPGGVLLLEAGAGQMPDIRQLFESCGFAEIRTYKDLAGLDRVISGKRKT
jgi:release factor glutamine methyltransferase